MVDSRPFRFRLGAMKLIFYIGRFVVLYLIMVLAAFLALLAYNGNFMIAQWSAVGRGWMVIFPLVATLGIFFLDMCDAFEDKV